MILTPPENQICISIFILFYVLTFQILGLKYCIFTCIFSYKIILFTDPSFSYFYFLFLSPYRNCFCKEISRKSNDKKTSGLNGK